MAALDYVQYTELVVAESHPSLSDVTNRPLKSVLTASGLATTVDPFPGFLPLTGGTRTVTDLIVAGGTPSTSGIALSVAQTTSTATSQYGVKVVNTASSAATVAGYAVYVKATTAAAAFVQTNQYGLYVDVNAKGAGATVTNTYGIYIAAQTVGGTLNIGLYNAGITNLAGVTTIQTLTVGLGGGAVATNVAFGVSTISSGAATGTDSVAIGWEALKLLSSGTRNVGVGSTALHNMSTGSSNVAIGYAASGTATGATNNIAIGDQALFYNINGSNIVAIGSGAGHATVNSSAIFIGFAAGKYETAGSCLYIDSLDRTDTAGDKAKSLLYGVFNATASSQTLKTNSYFTVTYGMGVGTSASVGIGIDISVSTVNTASQYGLAVSLVTSSASTTSGYGIFVNATTAAAAFTQTDHYGIYVAATAKGAGSTITNRYGLYVNAPTDGGTLNVGIYITGAAAGKASIANIGGNICIGGTAAGTAAVNTICFGATTGTSPSDSVDQVHLYGLDISAGHRSLAIWSEEVTNAAIATASTHRLPITINGVQYALLMTTVLS